MKVVAPESTSVFTVVLFSASLKKRWSMAASVIGSDVEFRSL
jgi:hypothetical protein